MMSRGQTLLKGTCGGRKFSPCISAACFPRHLPEIRLKSFLKGGEDWRENHFSFADHHDIRDSGSEKKGMLKGHFRASYNHLYPGESLPDPSQELKGALDVPQIQGAADEIGLPVEDLFQKVTVIEFLFFRRQPPRLVVGAKIGTLHSMGQIAGCHGRIFPSRRVVIKARHLKEEELLERLPVFHKVFLYHSTGIRTNAAGGLIGEKGRQLVRI
jgi:hypothetical protein